MVPYVTLKNSSFWRTFLRQLFAKKCGKLGENFAPTFRKKIEKLGGNFAPTFRKNREKLGENFAPTFRKKVEKLGANFGLKLVFFWRFWRFPRARPLGRHESKSAVSEQLGGSPARGPEVPGSIPATAVFAAAQTKSRLPRGKRRSASIFDGFRRSTGEMLQKRCFGAVGTLLGWDLGDPGSIPRASVFDAAQTQLLVEMLPEHRFPLGEQRFWSIAPVPAAESVENARRTSFSRCRTTFLEHLAGSCRRIRRKCSRTVVVPSENDVFGAFRRFLPQNPSKMFANRCFAAWKTTFLEHFAVAAAESVENALRMSFSTWGTMFLEHLTGAAFIDTRKSTFFPLKHKGNQVPLWTIIVEFFSTQAATPAPNFKVKKRDARGQNSWTIDRAHACVFFLTLKLGRGARPKKVHDFCPKPNPKSALCAHANRGGFLIQTRKMRFARTQRREGS
jgi:hypothetical protein